MGLGSTEPLPCLLTCRPLCQPLASSPSTNQPSQSVFLLQDTVIFRDVPWVRASAVGSQRGCTGGHHVLPG